MWRYGNTAPYKEHYACFRCRKAFKRPPESDLPEHARPQPGEKRIVPCPQCRVPMAEMDRDFEAPRQSDEKGWEVVEVLYRHGIRLAGGPGPDPNDLKHLEKLLAGRMTDSEGERLLRKIRQRMERS